MVWPSGAALATELAPIVPPAPTPVLDHEGLSNLLSDLLEHHASDDVAGDASGNRHNDRDGARRPILGCDRREAGQQHGGGAPASVSIVLWLSLRYPPVAAKIEK